MINRQSLLEGIISSFPICIAFTLIFFFLGMSANLREISLVEITIMSATIFSVPLQSFIIENKNYSLWFIVVNSFIFNHKFMLMSANLISTWQKRKLLMIPMLHFVCNSTYYLLCE